MKCALDTNIVSYIMREDENVIKNWKSEEKRGNRSVIPLMVYYEVKRGLVANGASVRLRLFEDLCDAFIINDLTISDMDTAAVIYANQKRKGKTIEDADLLIAAQCISNGYTLVTNNIKHFEGIENLLITNWKT